MTVSRPICGFTLALLVAGSLASAAVPSTMTPLSHIEANIRAEASNDETTRVAITLKNAQGKTQERVLHWRTITLATGDKRSLLYFDRPKSIEGTGLLTHENKTAEDERWLYLPALQKTRRISGSDKSDTFMGTDFSYEDLVTEEPENYDYAFGEIHECPSACVAVVATPRTEKEKAESGYSKRVLILDSSTHMVVSAEYYNKSGTHAKSFRASDFRSVKGDGAIRPFRMEMTDLINQHSTVMAFEAYQVDTGVAVEDISLRSLTQGH